MEGWIMSDIRTSALGGIPFGGNSGRPSGATGQPYFNGEEKRLELYTSAGWQNIVSETPGVVSVSGNYLESVGSATLEITGTNFTTGAIASVIGTNGVEINATSTTVNSIVSISAIFSGLSAANEPYDLKVTNTSNLFGLLPDSVYINQTPVWSTASGSLGVFTENLPFSIVLSSSDPENSSLTYSSSDKPEWMSINSSNGTLTGTPPLISTDTTYSFSVSVTDGGNSISRSFSITVNANPAVWSTTSPLPAFTKGSSYSITFSASDSSGVAPTYSLAAGLFPPGLSLNSTTGVLSGVPTNASSVSVTVRAVDNNYGYSDRVFSIPNVGLTWSTGSTLEGAVVNSAYSKTLIATNPNGDAISYSVSSGSLPSGLSLSTDGIISGTTSFNGTSSFTVLASDLFGNSLSRTFSLYSGGLGSAVTLPATTAHQIYTSNNSSSNGLYWIKPDLASTAKQMYCYFTGATGWIVLGRSVNNSTTYSNAPGFYNDGATPTASVNGSISLFDWSNTYMGNATKFRFFDPAVNSYVQWYCSNLTTIKAAPDAFSGVADAFAIRFESESGNTSGSLYKNFRVNPAQGQANVPNFIPDSGGSAPYGNYGDTMYIQGAGESGYRGFLITNGSSYESSYSKAGLGRYNPTPHRFEGVLLLANPR
jgi:hypothetical protein